MRSFIIIVTLMLSNKVSVENKPKPKIKRLKVHTLPEVIIKIKKTFNLKEIVNTLKYTETNNNLHAIGDNGKAFGVLQIHDVCVRDVNRLHNTNYKHKQMFKEKFAEEVTLLYLKSGIKRFKKIYRKSPTEEQVVRMHNGGIYKGYRIKATLPYYRRYLKIKNKTL